MNAQDFPPATPPPIPKHSPNLGDTIPAPGVAAGKDAARRNVTHLPSDQQKEISSVAQPILQQQQSSAPEELDERVKAMDEFLNFPETIQNILIGVMAAADNPFDIPAGSIEERRDYFMHLNPEQVDMDLDTINALGRELEKEVSQAHDALKTFYESSTTTQDLIVNTLAAGENPYNIPNGTPKERREFLGTLNLDEVDTEPLIDVIKAYKEGERIGQVVRENVNEFATNQNKFGELGREILDKVTKSVLQKLINKVPTQKEIDEFQKTLINEVTTEQTEPGLSILKEINERFKEVKNIVDEFTANQNKYGKFGKEVLDSITKAFVRKHTDKKAPTQKDIEEFQNKILQEKTEPALSHLKEINNLFKAHMGKITFVGRAEVQHKIFDEMYSENQFKLSNQILNSLWADVLKGGDVAHEYRTFDDNTQKFLEELNKRTNAYIETHMTELTAHRVGEEFSLSHPVTQWQQLQNQAIEDIIKGETGQWPTAAEIAKFRSEVMSNPLDRRNRTLEDLTAKYAEASGYDEEMTGSSVVRPLKTLQDAYNLLTAGLIEMKEFLRDAKALNQKPSSGEVEEFTTRFNSVWQRYEKLEGSIAAIKEKNPSLTQKNKKLKRELDTCLMQIGAQITSAKKKVGAISE